MISRMAPTTIPASVGSILRRRGVAPVSSGIVLIRELLGTMGGGRHAVPALSCMQDRPPPSLVGRRWRRYAAHAATRRHGLGRWWLFGSGQLDQVYRDRRQ